MRRLLTAALILCGGTLAHAQGRVADSTDAGAPGRIYLSWGAGYGLPGAAASLARACGDTTRTDTLYLSFDPGRACSTYVGMTATVWFRSLDGDSLGPIWRSPGGMSLPLGMKVEFPRDSTSAHPFPWAGYGIGFPGYARPGSNAGRLRLVWAVGPLDGARVEPGRLYGLARILLRRPAAGTPGCTQPVCVEWSEGTMAYRTSEEPVVSAGARFVGINAAGGEFSCSTAPPSVAPTTRPGKAKKASTGR
jgi:hypothetical protein